MKIYCPECENACSEKSYNCPRCGHPLAEPQRPLITIIGKPKWVIASSIIGLALTTFIYYQYQSHDTQPVIVINNPIEPTGADEFELLNLNTNKEANTKAGIGMTLSKLQTLIGPHNGWYWKQGQVQNTEDILHRATNRKYPNYSFFSLGPSGELSGFMVKVVIDTTAITQESQLRYLSVILESVEIITNIDQEIFLAWMVESLNNMAANSENVKDENMTYYQYHYNMLATMPEVNKLVLAIIITQAP